MVSRMGPSGTPTCSGACRQDPGQTASRQRVRVLTKASSPRCPCGGACWRREGKNCTLSLPFQIQIGRKNIRGRFLNCDVWTAVHCLPILSLRDSYCLFVSCVLRTGLDSWNTGDPRYIAGQKCGLHPTCPKCPTIMSSLSLQALVHTVPLPGTTIALIHSPSFLLTVTYSWKPSP